MPGRHHPDTALVAPEQARPKAVVNRFGETRHFHHYYGDFDGSVPGPQGFLLTMPPHNTGQAHYHRIDQFRVFFGSEGSTYQRHPMPSIMVHYSDAYSSYGPFTSGDKAIQFFTLRETSDGLVAYMPENRDYKILPSKRNITGEVDLETVAATEAGTTWSEDLIGRHDDHLRAELLVAAPGETVRGPLSEGSGQYYVVAAGAAQCDGEHYPHQSLGWVPHGSPPLELRAVGDQPAAVLVLQFPNPTTFPWPPAEDARPPDDAAIAPLSISPG